MAYDARIAELRDQVRQYPGTDVGSAEEVSAREAEKVAVLAAIERYGADRGQRLERLVSLLDKPDAEQRWEREANDARSTMHATLGDALRGTKTPTMLGLRIVVGATDEEDKVFDALARAKSVGAAMDAIVRYDRELDEKIDALKRKWDDSSRIAQTIMREEEDVLEEVRKLMAEAAASAAESHKNRRELFREFIKLAADAAKVLKAVVPVPHELRDLLDNTKAGTELWQTMAGDVNARRSRYEGYFSQDHSSVLVMFKGSRDEARDFLDKHDYTRLVLEWTSKARQGLADVRASTRTSGQQADIDAFVGAVTRKVDDAENAAKTQWNAFVEGDPTKFFGAFTPELDRALIGSERWEEKYRAIAAIDLQGLLSRWIDDDRRDWREVDVQDMPQAWHDELRATFKESLERLAATEEEIRRNNLPDALHAWITAKSSELANRFR